MKSSLFKTFMLGAFALLLNGCAGCGPPTRAVLEDPSACVPLEERQDCSVHEGDVLFLQTQEDIDAVCTSQCKLVTRIDVGGEIADLSVMRFTEIKPNNSITIHNVPELRSLAGLEAIEQVKLLTLRSLPKLSSLDGLGSLREVSHLDIESTGLTNLKGLESLEKVSAHFDGLTVFSNPNLKSLEGLDALQEVSRLQISTNPSLENLDGLASLQTAKTIDLSSNQSLRSLEGIAQVSQIQNVFIEQNASLPGCLVTEFAERVDPVEFRIGSNGPDSPEACD